MCMSFSSILYYFWNTGIRNNSGDNNMNDNIEEADSEGFEIATWLNVMFSSFWVIGSE